MGVDYYGAQLDLYGLLLAENGLQISGQGYLCSYGPGTVAGQGVWFETRLITLPVVPSRALELIQAAQGCLSGPQPAGAADCEYRRYLDARLAASSGPSE